MLFFNMGNRIEYIKFILDVPLLNIKSGELFRVYYDKNCTRHIKVDDLVLNVDKRKDRESMEIISKEEKY
jgi:hypothetical protein